MGAAVVPAPPPFLVLQDEFTAWLGQHANEEVVGLARMPRDCPLARYLGRHYTTGARHHAVHPTVIGVGRGYTDGDWQYYPAPAWVERFVRAADHLRPLTPITAAMARSFL